MQQERQARRFLQLLGDIHRIDQARSGDERAVAAAARVVAAAEVGELPALGGGDEPLAGVRADSAEVGPLTDALVASLPDLDADPPLPKAPWFPAGERWSARRVLMHIIAETAQHAGHADIIRESLDGAKSMA